MLCPDPTGRFPGAFPVPPQSFPVACPGPAGGFPAAFPLPPEAFFPGLLPPPAPSAGSPAAFPPDGGRAGRAAAAGSREAEPPAAGSHAGAALPPGTYALVQLDLHLLLRDALLDPLAEAGVAGRPPAPLALLTEAAQLTGPGAARRSGGGGRRRRRWRRRRRRRRHLHGRARVARRGGDGVGHLLGGEAVHGRREAAGGGMAARDGGPRVSTLPPPPSPPVMWRLFSCFLCNNGNRPAAAGLPGKCSPLTDYGDRHAARGPPPTRREEPPARRSSLAAIPPVLRSSSPPSRRPRPLRRPRHHRAALPPSLPRCPGPLWGLKPPPGRRNAASPHPTGQTSPARSPPRRPPLVPPRSGVSAARCVRSGGGGKPRYRCGLGVKRGEQPGREGLGSAGGARNSNREI